jgi:dTDP-4-amino-4,6-dideoxygalactose transaminase
MSNLTSLAREYGLPIVADAAAALGATFEGRPPAALGADLSVFSFNGNKTVTAGGGGAVVGDGKVLCDLVRHLTTTARSDSDYTHDRIGFNYRMTNLEGAIGCAQLERVDAYVEAKRAIANRYNNALTDLAGVEAFPAPEWAESACWFSGVTLTPPDAPAVAEIVPTLVDRGIGVRHFWKPVHLQAPYADAPRETLVTTEALWQRVLTLPCSTNLSAEDQARVVAELRACVDPIKVTSDATSFITVTPLPITLPVPIRTKGRTVAPDPT